MNQTEESALVQRYREAYRVEQELYRLLCQLPGGYKVAEMIGDAVRDELDDEEAWKKKQISESGS